MKKIGLFLFTMFLFVGCFNSKKDIALEIVDKTYVLEGTVAESQIDITFQKDKLVGLAGVNRYFSNYKIDGEKISINELGLTRMMGPQNLMMQEQEYLKSLKEAKKIMFTEKGILIITETGAKLNFVQK